MGMLDALLTSTKIVAHRQASTLTSIFPPKRTKILMTDSFQKVFAKMTDIIKHFHIEMLKVEWRKYSVKVTIHIFIRSF